MSDEDRIEKFNSLLSDFDAENNQDSRLLLEEKLWRLLKTGDVISEKSYESEATIVYISDSDPTVLCFFKDEDGPFLPHKPIGMTSIAELKEHKPFVKGLIKRIVE